MRPCLVFIRSDRECPDAVFSFLPRKTAAFARLPRAILLTAFFFITVFFILVHFSVAKCYRRLADLQSSEKPQSDQSTPNCQKGSQKCKNGNFIDLMQWSVGKPLTLVQAAHGKLQISERCNRRAPSEQPNCTSAKLSIAQVHRIIAHGCWLQPVCRSCRHTH